MAVVTVQELVSKAGLQEEDLDREVDPSEFYDVSTCLIQWKPLAWKIGGLNEWDIDAIECDSRNEEDRRMNFLSKLKQKRSMHTTYGLLVTTLVEIGRGDDARRLCEILASLSSKQQSFNSVLSAKPVIAIGKVGCGKSTALNNLYGLNLPAKSSSKPVTTSVTKELKEKNKNWYYIIDTPGIKDDGSISESLHSLFDEFKSKDFTLVFCLSIKPGDPLTESDEIIVKKLTSHFGERVWEKCVLLLTYSDLSRSKFGTSTSGTNNYTKYISTCTVQFHDLLIKSGLKVPSIVNILDVIDNNHSSLHLPSMKAIVAVPVQKRNHENTDILAGKIQSHWTTIAERHIDAISCRKCSSSTTLRTNTFIPVKDIFNLFFVAFIRAILLLLNKVYDSHLIVVVAIFVAVIVVSFMTIN